MNSLKEDLQPRINVNLQSDMYPFIYQLNESIIKK